MVWKSKYRKTNLFIGLFITLLMALLLTLQWGFLEVFEDKLYDWHYKFRGPIKAPEQIVIAAIDEKSLERLGRWPWSRDQLARLIERLDQTEAGLIVLDVIFSEAEKNDRLLGKTIEKNGLTLVPISFDCGQGDRIPLNNQTVIQSAFQKIDHPERLNLYAPFRGKKITLPVPEVLERAMALGHINMFADRDGTLRWEAVAIEYDGYLFPSLDLQAAAIYLGVPADRIILRAAEGVQLGNKRTIPTDHYGRMLIHYYGPERTFPHLSIADLLEGRIPPEAVRGKIVLIGPTAAGIYDLRVTPYSAALPGIEKHANVIASILDQKFLQQASYPLNLGILFFSGVIFSLCIIRMKAVQASIITILAVLAVLLAGYAAFEHWGLWINRVYPSLNIISIFVGITAYNYTAEERYARKMRAMFSSYLTERVVSELIKNPQMAQLGGSRRVVTILFSDIRGFTSFSEKHAPEEVVYLLNEYLEAMTEVVFHWEGTLDKFIGDAIMAFWGAPMEQENQAVLAVRCALHMVDRLAKLQQKWEAEGKPILQVGIGINTGEVLVGNIGAEGKKMDYTIIGDHVNLGSRVESLTKRYRASILITQNTLDRLKEPLAANSLGHLSIRGIVRGVVKGRNLPINLYALSPLEPGQTCHLTECPEDQVVHFDEK